MDVGIIVITHGRLSDALVETLFSIVGKKDKVISLPVPTEFTLESLCNSIKEVIKKMDSKYVIILTDVLGGTPCNASLKLVKEFQNVQIISGVNLYMLISAVNLRETMNESFSFEEYVDKVISESKKSIANATEILSKKIK